MKFFREEMLKCLREGKVNLTFTKVDGTDRVMNATLVEKYIPQDQRPTSHDNARKESDTAIRVFDVDLNSWRSFRVDSVKKFSPVE